MTTFAVLLFFAIGLVGLTHIIVDSKFFAPIRDLARQSEIKLPFGHSLYDLLSCYQCAGTWVGILLSWTALPFLPIQWNFIKIALLPLVFLVSGGGISVLSVLARALIDWLTLNIQIPEALLNEDERDSE